MIAHTIADTSLCLAPPQSFEDPPPFAGNAVGKEGLREYMDSGDFAIDMLQDGGDRISRALDFGFADFAVSNALKVLAELPSNSDKRGELLQRATTLAQRSTSAASKLFDKGSGLMAPKDRSGRTVPGFNPFEWGNGFTEGNAWHHSFPPYALPTLVQLHGSESALLVKLHQILTAPGRFDVGSYGQEIH